MMSACVTQMMVSSLHLMLDFPQTHVETGFIPFFKHNRTEDNLDKGGGSGSPRKI